MDHQTIRHWIESKWSGVLRIPYVLAGLGRHRTLPDHRPAACAADSVAQKSPIFAIRSIRPEVWVHEKVLVAFREVP